MASSVLVYTNSTPQEWSVYGALDHASAIDEDISAPDLLDYVFTPAPIGTYVGTYGFVLPVNLGRMNKIAVSLHGIQVDICGTRLIVSVNGVDVFDSGIFFFPLSDPGTMQFNITGINIVAGDAVSWSITGNKTASTRQRALLFTANFIGSYTTEKQIEGSICTEKTISVSACSEKSIVSTPNTTKTISSSPCTEKIIVSTP